MIDIRLSADGQATKGDGRLVKDTRRFTLSVIISAILCTLTFPSAAAEEGFWVEEKGQHFIVYYMHGGEELARRVLRKAEEYYKNIATDLGYPRHSAFWLWDNRAKIYLYPDRETYLEMTGQPYWSEGLAEYSDKKISSFILSEMFVESILPHEMAHLIFRDFVGFKGEVPLWLDEGVAQWAEMPKRQIIKRTAKHLYNTDSLLSIEDMMGLDIRGFTQKDMVYIRPTQTKEGEPSMLFLSLDRLISNYYVQGVSLVDFLIGEYGSQRFAHFCRQLRDGKKMEEALRFAYPTYIRSISDLEDKWREYLAEDD
ncbi:MAG: hypothetical protein ABID09_02585 [Candidatus Omnitrophota bacterium]